MSKQYPECPLFNHENCKELHNRKVCAIVRKDKVCLRNIPKAGKKARKRKGTEETIERDKTTAFSMIRTMVRLLWTE